MWVRLTTLKFDPAQLDQARSIYNSSEVSGVFQAQKGHRYHCLMESADQPGEAISFTAWDSREDAERYEQSGTYRTLVDKVRAYSRGEPELRSYEIKE